MQETEKKCRICRHFQKGYCDLMDELVHIEIGSGNNRDKNIKDVRVKIINYDSFNCSKFE